MKPARGRLLVRRAETEETMPGGRIILTENERQKLAAYQMQVVKTGEPERCQKPRKCKRRLHGHKHNDLTHPIQATEGDWILVQPRSLTDACHETDTLYIINQDDVLGIFKTEDEIDEELAQAVAKAIIDSPLAP